MISVKLKSSLTLTLYNHNSTESYVAEFPEGTEIMAGIQYKKVGSVSLVQINAKSPSVRNMTHWCKRQDLVNAGFKFSGTNVVGYERSRWTASVTKLGSLRVKLPYTDL